MISSESMTRFKSLLAARPDGEIPKGIVSCMLEFYRSERVEDCDLEEDGDMLLFQWGTYDWGEGRWFDLNITRQFIVPSEDEDDEIFQMSASAKFVPSLELDALKSGNTWCHSPDDLSEFSEFIEDSQAMKSLGSIPPDHLEIKYNTTG
ncbi:MAG: hypothetical protein WD342_19830 [Verrucomicrobiales bacterium]